MDMMTEVFNVGDKVECVRDSPDNNDSIAIGLTQHRGGNFHAEKL